MNAMPIGKVHHSRNWRPSVLSAALVLAIAFGVGAFSALAMHSTVTALRHPEAIETAAAIDSLL